MKLQPALLQFLARISASTESLNKSATSLLPYSGPLSGLDSHPQKRKSCESPTGEVTLLLGHRNSQVKINTSETKEHLAGLDYRKAEGGKARRRKWEWRQGEGSSSTPEAGKYRVGGQWELLGRAEKQVKVRASLISEYAAKNQSIYSKRRRRKQKKLKKNSSKLAAKNYPHSWLHIMLGGMG